MLARAETTLELITSERSCKGRQSCRGRGVGRRNGDVEEIEWRPLEDPTQPIFIALIYVVKRWQLQTGLIQFLPPGLLTWNTATRELWSEGGGGTNLCICVCLRTLKKEV